MTARDVHAQRSPAGCCRKLGTTRDADDYVPTGRTVGGLHESLSSANQSGRDGSDLFE